MTRDLIGQQLGNYRLVSLLGQGGFAEVYLGQHVRLSMQAAIKVLHTHLSDEQIQGFQHEAETIANLIHPHIVRVLDFDVPNGIPFLVMDYCPDGTLRKRHPKGERVPLLTVVSYVQQVADALQYAHDQKLIHRDVKPENMLIGQYNDILLSDFGIASAAHNTSSMSMQVPLGTIPYMAPEQIQAHARPASDQYSLGIVVYEWLCGECPFEGSHTEIFAKHLMTPPPPLLPKVPTLPPEVEQVVLTALAKNPHQRFATIQTFAAALQQASQAKLLVPMPTQPNVTLSQPLPAQVPTALATPVIPTVDQSSTQRPNVAPYSPLKLTKRLSPQLASLQVPAGRKRIDRPYHPPIELKPSERSRPHRSVQIGLSILTVIAIIIASTVISQPLSSTLTQLFSSTNTGTGNLDAAATSHTMTAIAMHKITLTVGGTSDDEGQVLTKLYTLLLRKAGFTVKEKPALGDSNTVFAALQSGSIDIYPEFTFTGLQRLGIASAQDTQKDYQTVKNGFEQRFKITWLNPAPLNDGYALCTTQDEAAQLHINTISDLAPQVPGLILASTNDGIAFVDSLKSVYNFDSHSFKSLSTYVLEGISLDAVDNNHAQISVCYITDASIKARNFVFLIDDKNGFPQFHPAPIVRDNVLHKNPAIANALNPLAPKLTTDVSIELQARVQQLRSWGKPSPDAITQVATDFLTNQGLL